MLRNILIAALALPALLFAEKKPDIGNVADIVTIVELKPDSPFQKTWQPGLALLSNGTYLVSYGLELKGKVDMGSVMATTSPDHGKNWSEPLPIFDSTHITPDGKRFAYANSVLYQEPESKLVWCFAMRCPYEFKDSENSELVAAVSEDSGKTWTPREITNSYDSHLITCAGIVRLEENGKPRYLLPVHRNTFRHDPKNGDRRQFVLESPDLIHWSLAGMIPFPENGEKIFLHEGNIAPGQKKGTLEMVIRTATYADYLPLDPPRAYSSISTDGGRTWSPAKQEPALYNTVSKAFFGQNSDGSHIHIYNTGDRWERRELWYQTRPPEGDWSEPRLFYSNNNRNSYATLIEEKPGQWACVWDSSNDPEKVRTAIRFGRLKL